MDRLGAQEITFKEAKIEQQSAALERLTQKWKVGLENGSSVVTFEEKKFASLSYSSPFYLHSECFPSMSLSIK